MQSIGKELPEASYVGYNKKGETIFPAGTSNLQKAKSRKLSVHMQVFRKRRGNRNEEKRNRKSGGAGDSCIL